MTHRPQLPRKIARAVLANTRQSLVPLIYSTIAPSFYLVYLHPDDYAAVEGLIPVLRDQIARALDETTDDISSPPWWERVLHPGRELLPPIETILHRSIEIVPDPNDEVPPGEVAVHSEVRLPVTVEYAGSPTVRVTTTTTVNPRPRHLDVALRSSASAHPEAWLTIEDLEGRREHDLVDNPTLIGRGGLGCYVHVRLRTDGQVSQEHCRIRRDESGDFLIKDLSRNGTTLNGELLPRGVEYFETQKRELDGREVALPDGARIGLADVVYLDFRRARA